MNFQIRLLIFTHALITKIWRKRNVWMHVHEAVVENKEVETGITIHYVNENYDEGAIIFQAKCEVFPDRYC